MGNFITESIRIFSQILGFPPDEELAADNNDSKGSEMTEPTYCEARSSFELMTELPWGECRDPESFDTAEAAEEKKRSSEAFENYILGGLSSMGRGVLGLRDRAEALWDAQPEGLKTFVKFAGMALEDYLSPDSSDSETTSRWKINDGVIKAALKFRGKDYEVRAEEGLLTINGKSWKFEGTNAATKMASMELESMRLDSDEESLELNIKGSVLFVEKKISKTLYGDQVESLLTTLTEGDAPIATPEMEANGIRLVPV